MRAPTNAPRRSIITTIAVFFASRWRLTAALLVVVLVAGVILLLSVLNRILQRNADPASSHKFRNQLIMSIATFVGLLVVILGLPIESTTRGQLLGLIGIIIASVVNMFLKSSGMAMIISYIGVFIFVGLTVYDTQRLKNMALTQPADADGAVVRKGAILGALSLYLDFINLFLMLLQLFGMGGGDD